MAESSRRNTTDLLQEHQSQTADHFEVLFKRFLDVAREKARQYTSRLPQAHGHTSSAAAGSVRQALAWIVASPEKISLDNSDVFERVLATIVYRRCIDACRRESRRKQQALDDHANIAVAPNASTLPLEDLVSHLRPLVESAVEQVLMPLDEFRRLAVSLALFERLSAAEIEQKMADYIQTLRAAGRLRGTLKSLRTIQLWIHDARKVLLQILLRDLGFSTVPGTDIEQLLRQVLPDVIAGIASSDATPQKEDGDVS
ncbi:MAG: hypothetical protein RLZZ536_988 [Planctomycetota bacterium]|jgi:DNA-directed RNA polymerase specialized sigma24 family protein